MVRIITDSAADFEPQEYEQMDVKCIPLYVSFGDREYQENVNLSKEEFYSLLVQSKEFPRTSQPSPYTVECMLKEAMDAGDETVILSLSSAISGTYQSILAIKNRLGYEKCYPIDSRNATGGLRMLVEQAVKLRDMGKNAQEIVREIEALRSRVVLYACIDTLEYLHRGGRISGTAYRVGSVAHIKPVIHVNTDGGIDIPAKAVGMRKGMDFLCKRLEVLALDENYPLYVMFSGNRTNGDLLVNRLLECGYTVPESHVIPLGASIGSHIGPNACGIVYISKA